MSYCLDYSVPQYAFPYSLLCFYLYYLFFISSLLDYRRLTFTPHSCFFFFFQAEDGIRDLIVTGVQTCALPISRDGHRLPGVAAHVAVDVARPRGQLFLECAEPLAQIPHRGLGALLHFRAVRAAARPQQRFGLAHQRAQLLGELPGIECLGHGDVPRPEGSAWIYAYPHRNRETRAAGCATLAQEWLYERAGTQSVARVAQARRERLARRHQPPHAAGRQSGTPDPRGRRRRAHLQPGDIDRKSTRLNSSHDQISYAVFCLKKKKNNT